MAFKKKKGEAGEAKRYITRNRASKLLQLSLPEFRRLCILKGIYPREPKSRKKAQKGDSNIKTLYLKRDIIYLTHEPIIWKMREQKIYRRKVKALRAKKEIGQAKFHQNFQRPIFKLDHIVLERYPSFDKALQDFDDALSACFVYAALPNVKGIDSSLVHLCRRLTTEFLNYVIESRTLRKTFISIKGYFYRAHIQGEKITWMIPHPFPPQCPELVDIRIMRVFIEFYCTLLGFVNFKLYQSLNLYYPPKLPFKVKRQSNTTRKEEELNVIESLSTPLRREFVEGGDDDDDEYDLKLMNLKNDKKLKLAKQDQEKVKKQMILFNKMKFFLGRETNRESLAFVIRSAGGLVSWDASLGSGTAYGEEDKTIVYQIVDRPNVEKKHLSRYYVQPQWVYDSFNAAILLPVQNYFVGVELPAHMSPFEETYNQLYTPPEMHKIKALQNRIKLVGDKTTEEFREDPISGDDEEKEVLPESGSKEEEEKIEEEEKKIEEEEEKMEEEEEEEKEEETDPLAKMKVWPGCPVKRNLAGEKRYQEFEDFKLASTFIHRKQKRLFKRILDKERKSKRWAGDLKRKRLVYEREMQRRRRKAAANKANCDNAAPSMNEVVE